VIIPGSAIDGLAKLEFCVHIIIFSVPNNDWILYGYLELGVVQRFKSWSLSNFRV
jgi:hypothetical protein